MHIDENTYTSVQSTLNDLFEAKAVTKAQVSRDTDLGSEWLGYFSTGRIKDAGWHRVFTVYKWLIDNGFFDKDADAHGNNQIN